MEPELPSQRNCHTGLMPQTTGMLKLGTMTSELGLRDLMPPELLAKTTRKLIL